MKKLKKALVLGLGASGEAAVGLLLRDGTDVTVIDRSEDADILRSARRISRRGVEVLTGADKLPADDFDICVASPGIAPSSDWFRQAAARRIPVISELELGFSRCRCPVLAITGSNGKSTLVRLCGDALRLAGKRVALGGNYGEPLSSLALKSDGLDWLIVEVSSFQLERVETFSPKVAVVLNLNPNHLDRHGNMRTYIGLKMRIFARMRGTGLAVVPEDRLKALERSGHGSARVATFGCGVRADYRYADGMVISAGKPCGVVLPLTGTIFGNRVMGLTAAAAVAAVRGCGVKASFVGEAARRFKPLEHRLNRVRLLDGVTFVDDSKATNLAAMKAGIEICGGSVLLIAGGMLKESGLGFVKKTLAKHVRRAYFIGHSAKEMKRAWGGIVECRVCGDMKRAVLAARLDARPGETVLLSPAGTSFDQYGSFEERGKHFAKIVKSLKEKR
ncbi:MAG: UDP-N-acetylmuramoyl-L-alanine--D-glutamate ligase [Verrucomicrobia bacterium]|nr:UDP-N-acetylmuramoyl-L-alanine--D-glutamate ligase [Verrucomicrobiota bacterium]